MKKLPGYKILECIYSGNRSNIYRGLRAEDGQPVIIKTCPNHFPSAKDLNRFQREFKIGRELNHKNIIKYFSLERDGHGWAVVDEDFGAISLAKIMSASGMELLKFLKIAIQLADGVGEMHRLDIVHKDIKPGNIVINEKTGQVKLIDFSLSSHLREEPSFQSNLSNIEGTLTYISPEQTGRMNRGVDFRTDFYSLGVTFYEILSGALPFNKKEPLELVYCHIAKNPAPLNEVNPGIPRAVSDIVMKLLEKCAEDRYQSAYGLKVDLEKCLRQMEGVGEISDLSAGENDLSEGFHIHQKLYGRKKEVDTILEAFEQVSGGKVKSILTLVSGYSGIGKSSLIHEIYKPLARKNGYFISGKFDQFKRNIPYASVIQAFQQLIKLILTESKENIADWKRDILEAVGANGRVITDVIPDVEHVIGPQPPVPELGATENRNRFNRIFLNFSRVFAKPDHPLVIFLDDLQWADIPTFHLIELMLVDPDCKHLLFIGAYRDNEVSDSHPLIKTLKDIRKKRPIHNLSLLPLELEHVDLLISDSFKCSLKRARSLAEITQQKTRGNPFFIKMFLKSLYQEKRLYFQHSEGMWQWDANEIANMGITDNVVEFMTDRLQKLPTATVRILSIASLIGNQFDLKLLAHAQKTALADIAGTVWPAVKEGLILPLGEKFNWVEHNWDSDDTVLFRFLHDRVQQAADSLLPENEKARLHLALGRIHLEIARNGELSENIFTVANHLNKGSALIGDRGESRQLAQLNLTAARKAKLSSAYEPALDYVTCGMNLLPENCWETDYDLAFSYFIEKGEILYLNSKWDEAIKTFDIALGRAKTLLNRCKINEYKANLYRMKNDLRTALNTGLQALEELNIVLKPFPGEAEVKEEIGRVQPLINAYGVENLYDLPELKDPQKLAALELLRACFAPAYFLGSRLISIIGARMSEITIKHGNSPLSSVGYIFYSAISLAVDLEDFDNAHKLGLLALKLNDRKFHEKVNEALLLDMWGTFVCHHKEPIDNAREHLMRGYFSGVENGSYQWAGYCAMINLFMSFWGPDSLPKVSEKIEKILPGLEKIDPNMAQYYYAVKAAIHNLINYVEAPISLSQDVWPNIEKVLEASEKQDDLLTLLVDTTCRLSLANWYDDSKNRVLYAEKGARYAAGVPGVFINPVFHFHQALAFAAGYESAEPFKKPRYLECIRTAAAKFDNFAGHCPGNYSLQAKLIAAELARIEGRTLEAMDLYDQAIDSAQKNGFLQNGALANEFAARFYLSLGKERIAQVYLGEAHYAYQRWGAKAKLAHFTKKYSRYLTASGTENIIPGSPGITTPANSIELAPLDLATVMKASQAISKEINLADLLATMMKIILESAGAQTGFLILREKDGLRVRAKTGSSSDAIEIPPRLFLEECKDVSETVVRYVFRSGQSVVLHNASEEGMFTADPHIVSRHIRSLLCLPVIHKGEATGVLYLENNLTTFAFPDNRIRILEVLLSQAAISLENARLYTQTTELNRELHNEIEERIHAEFALRKSEEMNRSVLDNAMDGIITINVEGVIQTFNPAAEKIFGLKSDQAVGENIAALMPQPYSDEHAGHIHHYLATKKSNILGFAREVPGKRLNGDIFPMELSVSEMLLEGQQIFIGITRDISERKSAEEKLRRYAKDLEISNEELKHFTYSASHDLQEPLRKIIAFGDRLVGASTRLDANERDYLQRIQKATFRMKDLIDDLLGYTRLSHKQFDFETVDLKEVAQEIISDLEVLIERSNGNIEIGALPKIEADKIQIRQLFQNLISNGLKYCKPETPAHISIKSVFLDNGFWNILFADNGIGFNEKYAEKIFLPFQRLHSDQKIPGSGMGLFICKKIVERHDGNISVKSQPQEGSTFIVSLPVKRLAKSG